MQVLVIEARVGRWCVCRSLAPASAEAELAEATPTPPRGPACVAVPRRLTGRVLDAYADFIYRSPNTHTHVHARAHARARSDSAVLGYVTVAY